MLKWNLKKDNVYKVDPKVKEKIARGKAKCHIKFKSGTKTCDVLMAFSITFLLL